MQTTIRATLAAFVMLAAAPAWSIVIVDSGALNGTDVGMIDDIIAQTSHLNASGTCGPGSSEATEECWAEFASGLSLELAGKSEDVDWYATDQSNVIAFALSFGPGHYIVKNARAWVLVANLAMTDWGVLNLGAIDVNLNLGDDMEISHVTQFGRGETQVPEPGTLALFGAGLLGAAFMRRRQRR